MKTIVITGATSGIGKSLTEEFANKGYVVFAGYRNVKFKKDLEKISSSVIPFRIDLSKDWTISDSIKFICSKTDKIDVLINGAGCAVAGSMESLSVAKIKEQFEVNTFSHLQFTQGLFDKLEGGKIINISSMASYGIFPFIAPYCASKRALDILFNCMQLECKSNIKIVSVKPGVIKTPFWEKSIEGNKEFLDVESKYQKEYDFLMENARKNSKKGLDTKAVVDLIIKIEGLENPKSSYTVGLDAKLAQIISILPQDWLNFIIKKSFEKRCNK